VGAKFFLNQEQFQQKLRQDKMAEISKEAEQKINQLQLFEQSLQNILMQKQQFQGQIVEVDSALTELEKSKESYKIVGNIMVKSDKEALKKDLEEQKKVANMRIEAIEKQEKQIQEKVTKLQEEAMKDMKD